MPNETMEKTETQTAEPTNAVTEETLQQEPSSEPGAGSDASETSPTTENESQTPSQEESASEQTLGENADDQPVTPPTGQPAPASHDYAKENADLRAMIAQTMDVIKQREQVELQKSKPQAQKGAWKETLAKTYKPEDASVLSAAMEAAIAERLEGIEAVQRDVQFLKPHVERMGYENEMSRASAALVAAGVPQSVVAALRPDVDAAYKSGIVAPPEMVMWSAYAKHAAKEKSALATKTLQARTQTKPKPPAPKNTTGPTGQPKYVINKPVPGADPIEEMASFLEQFGGRYKS